VLTLLDRICSTLSAASIPHALIGAAAMAVYGVSRSTFDRDLLVTDTRVLESAFWTGLPAEIVADVRRGDADDPLAGVVRFTCPGERDLDIVVGKSSWQTEIVERAGHMRVGTLAVAEAADLVLLKLYAGGVQDRWDIAQLLALDDGEDIGRDVERRLGALPRAARDRWSEVRR
jgi:hypothetical protein